MLLKRNKEEKEPIDGIFADAIDYDFYQMTLIDKIIGFTIGFIVSFIAIQLYFGLIILSIIFALIAGIISISLYQKKIIENNQKKLVLQFRDLLDALSNSFSVGNNITNSFIASYEDVISQHGKESFIAKETYLIVVGMQNGLTIEELLYNFAQRSHSDDILDFCNTFNACTRLGGNLKVVVNDCKDIISQKIDVQLEIASIIAGSKNQLNIIAIMPFALVGIMSFMGFKEMSAINFTTIMTKVIALIVFIISYFVGLKMTKIEL